MGMGMNVQIPDIPDDLYLRLAAGAEKAGVPLSDYFVRKLRKVVELEAMEEALDRLRTRSTTQLLESPADIIRAARDSS